ncbi:unnamed protein product [Bemisia tabaci]|uniref:AAA-ATPase-like domain-containing protein n=1 Tax=Bemisia tabaci TaxID=7038 RepID=A0A9P0ANF7_BEMTA|nr:unnamed protein product [Bemisia tabaci]
MDFKDYLYITASIIFCYFGRAVPHIPYPNEEFLDDSLPPATYKPLVPINECAVLPGEAKSVLSRLVDLKCYVDKTEFLYKMVQEPQELWSLARPRRFGKSLFVDTVKSFFEGKKTLFDNTKIYQHYRDRDWPKHPVISLDFSDVESHSFDSFYHTLLEQLEEAASLHEIHLGVPRIATAFRRLVDSLHKKFNNTVVILVDEYDAPYRRSYANNKELAGEILEALRTFFSVLKKRVAKIRYSFITGITRIALSDFFSGANAVRDITMDPEYANIMGFTKNELELYFGGFVKKLATSKGKNTEEIMGIMKKWHDGFRFTIREESLYSPVSVLAFLRTGSEVRAWSKSGGPTQCLVHKLNEFPVQTMEMVLKDESNETDSALIATEGDLSGKYVYSEDNIASLISLLFHNGYLSISKYDSRMNIFTLKFTNLELKEDFSLRVYMGITGMAERSMVNQMDSAVQDLNDRKWISFIEHLNATYSRIPFEHLSYQKPRLEAWFQFVMYIMLELKNDRCQSKLLVMEDTTNKGRADIVYSVGKEVIIFQPKMDNNPENPVYECKEKYIRQYLFGQKENVTCFDLKFTRSGIIESWGVAVFSNHGKLIEEDGNILLSFQLHSEEKQNITSEFKNFKRKHPNFTLQPEELIEFLEKIGPTATDESVFAEKFTADIESLCIFLSRSKHLFEPNLRGIIHGFLERRKKDKKRAEKEENGGGLLKKSVMLFIH